MYRKPDVKGLMDRTSSAVWAAGTVAVTVFALLLTVPLLPPEETTEAPIYAAMETPYETALDGRVMPRVPTPSQRVLGPDDLAGPAPQAAFGVYEDRPVLVVKLARAALTEASEEYGHDTTRYGVLDAGGDTVYLAFDTRSTYMGCQVAWMPELGATPTLFDRDGDGRADGRVLDVCHQGQWDLYGLAYPAPYTPAPRPLDTIELGLRPVDGRPAFMALDRIEWAAPFTPA